MHERCFGEENMNNHEKSSQLEEVEDLSTSLLDAIYFPALLNRKRFEGERDKRSDNAFKRILVWLELATFDKRVSTGAGPPTVCLGSLFVCRGMR